ncbi:MAG: hypothetical protein LCI00_19350 [Chloroflexi bacterium]|nr:hypothetical protein [Chloroflexota bacterium]MCC6891442.1 hypothetical protein [Anaerolineae bacterium]
MQAAVKTTVNFSPAFHNKLKQVADQHQKPMSQLIEDYLTPIIDNLQERKRRGVFDGLKQLEGIVSTGTEDASATIDEFLYGWGSGQATQEKHE